MRISRNFPALRLSKTAIKTTPDGEVVMREVSPATTTDQHHRMHALCVSCTHELPPLAGYPSSQWTDEKGAPYLICARCLAGEWKER